MSRDGVLDLGGSLREHTQDLLAAYTDACWNKAGVLQKPVCTMSAETAFVMRGAAFNSALWEPIAALRRTDLNEATLDSVGFRCAYPDPDEAP